MLKNPINTCVKYVNNYRISRGLNSGDTSTTLNTPTKLPITLYVKVCKMSINTPSLSNNISTTKNHYSNLLNKSFTHNPQPLLLKPLKEN